MAEIKSFPNNQDVYVGAEWVMKWLHGRTSGVFGADGNLAITVVPDSMSIQISDGTGWLSNANGDGIVFWNDSEQTNGRKLTLTHDVADGVLDRIDRVVVTWETTNYVALPTISILKGTASSAPVPPALTNNNIQRQISLAKVKIPAGTVSLKLSMVTDERLDPDVCGIVTESVSIDTEQMHSQFEELLKAIEEELSRLNSGTEVVLKSGGVQEPVNNDQVANKVYVDTSARKAAPRNVLDNSDFLHFVAQAGVGGTHGAQAYAGDRWILVSGSVTGEANANGDGYTAITLDGTIRQVVANPPDVATVCMEMVSGTADISYEGGAVTISSAGGVLKNAALYEGTYTAVTMPEYRADGYAAELADCWYYYRRFSGEFGSLSGYISSSATVVDVMPPDTTPMRINNPTIAFTGGIILRGVAGYSDDADASKPYNNPKVFLRSAAGGLMSVGFTKNMTSPTAWKGITNNTPVSLSLKNFILEFNADM